MLMLMMLTMLDSADMAIHPPPHNLVSYTTHLDANCPSSSMKKWTVVVVELVPAHDDALSLFSSISSKGVRMLVGNDSTSRWRHGTDPHLIASVMAMMVWTPAPHQEISSSLSRGQPPPLAPPSEDDDGEEEDMHFISSQRPPSPNDLLDSIINDSK